ncbi:MAG: hypothetical protein IJV00_04800 [Clostridia bacterium]|nr:hypothetical protein [Clostridia bacterium]
MRLEIFVFAPAGVVLSDARNDYSFLRLEFPDCTLSSSGVARLIVVPSGSSPDSPATVLNLKIVSPEIYVHSEPLSGFPSVEQ